jgi:hypothetical protein
MKWQEMDGVFEWDVVEDSEMWGHVCDLALGERAQIGWFFNLLCFEAAGVVCQRVWRGMEHTRLLLQKIAYRSANSPTNDLAVCMVFANCKTQC